MFSAQSVLHRLQGTGRLTHEDARNLGLVGLVARSSGISLDTRMSHPGFAFGIKPIAIHVASEGDCFARISVRREEITESLNWIESVLNDVTGVSSSRLPVGVFRPNSLVVSIVEGWRGEIVHCMETDNTGSVINYHLQDPSLRNWFGLAMALRKNAIYDFPVCNKSFDLSYCGHDL